VKVDQSLAELQRILPSLPRLGIGRSWAGYIDATPDLAPVLGATPALRGLVLATGFSGHGFAMGPVAGRLVAELIVDGKTSLDISVFRFSRFAEGAIARSGSPATSCEKSEGGFAPFRTSPRESLRRQSRRRLLGGGRRGPLPGPRLGPRCAPAKPALEAR
jgi:hypothetical protein